LVRPVTTAVVAAPTESAVNPPGDDVTVYPVIAAPPLSVGAVQDTSAWRLPAVAKTVVGAVATREGVTARDPVAAADVPMILVAVTVKV
jgi:hypothetical protein